jgi:hypothetical protein
MDIEPIIPFGKYKGKPITTLLKDTNYLEWCKQQEWFKKFPIVYNICVNQTIVNQNENSKTPEHNKIQNLFLEEGNVKNLLVKVFKLKLNHLCIDTDPKYSVKFEKQYNWDLFIDRIEFWYCSCPDDDNFKCVCEENKNFIKRYNIPRNERDEGYSKYTGNIYCEIKPLLGDDYPCVLRKMNTQIKLSDTYISLENEKIKISHQKIENRIYYNSSDAYKFDFQESIIKPNYILFVKDFASSTTTKEQLIQIFNQSNIKVIFLKDIIEGDVKLIETNIDNISELKEYIIKLEKENTILKERLKQYETPTS